MTMDIWGYQQWITPLRVSQALVKSRSKKVRLAKRPFNNNWFVATSGSIPDLQPPPQSACNLGYESALVQNNLNTAHQWRIREKMEAPGAVAKALYNGKSEIFLKPSKWIQEGFYFRYLKFRFCYQSGERAASTLLSLICLFDFSWQCPAELSLLCLFSEKVLEWGQRSYSGWYFLFLGGKSSFQKVYDIEHHSIWRQELFFGTYLTTKL